MRIWRFSANPFLHRTHSGRWLESQTTRVKSLAPQIGTTPIIGISVITEVGRLVLPGQNWREGTSLTLTFVDAFYDDAGFIDAFAAVGGPILKAEEPDHVLMSFHGLPERHVRKSDPGGSKGPLRGPLLAGSHCLADKDCCLTLGSANRDCYRAQCFATAKAVAARLGLPAGAWRVSFQSRLGRTRWIEPYTDVVLRELAAEGKKRLLVYCPAFVADCLETLEEIGIRGREQFRAAGGEELTLVPSLNSSGAWADAVAALARRHAGRVLDPNRALT